MKFKRKWSIYLKLKNDEGGEKFDAHVLRRCGELCYLYIFFIRREWQAWAPRAVNADL